MSVAGHEPASRADRQIVRRVMELGPAPCYPLVPSAPWVRAVDGLGRGDVTVVFVHGEHDYGSRSLVRGALDGIVGDAIVDLSWCGLLDSTIIGLMLAKHATVTRAGHRFEVIVPPAHTQLTRVFEVFGLRAVLSVLDELPDSRR